MNLPKPAISLGELAQCRDSYTDSKGREAANYNLGCWQIGGVLGDITPGRWTATNRKWEDGDEEPMETMVFVYDESEIDGLDKYAFTITDAPGALMGFGPTRELAIASAAEALDISFEEAELKVEETEDYAHSGSGYVEWQDRLCIDSRAGWEECAGLTIEEYLGEDEE